MRHIKKGGIIVNFIFYLVKRRREKGFGPGCQNNAVRFQLMFRSVHFFHAYRMLVYKGSLPIYYLYTCFFKQKRHPLRQFTSSGALAGLDFFPIQQIKKFVRLFLCAVRTQG